GAVAIGLVAGVVVWISEWMMIHIFRIDDPVNVVPAHGFAGAWGTIALALFAPVTALPLADRLSQLGVQLLGVGAVFVWGFGLGVLLFSVLKMVDFLRVDPEGEQAGLNISEHGARSGMFDTMNAMWQIATAQQGGDGDLTRRIHVEIGTEAGDLATIFNKFMDGFESIIAKFGLSITTLSGASTRLNSISDKLSVGAKKQLDETQDISIAVHQLSATISEVAQNTALTAQAAQQAAIEAAEGKKVVMDSVSMMDRLANEVQSASAVVSKLKQNAKEIDSMVQVINDISEQTNLLALNASIEAARAGEAGRGFAIVADEVRQLSTRTREATMQIKAVVDNLSIGTDQAVSVMDHSHDISKSTVESAHKSANLLSEITQSVEKISDMSSQIAAAAEEQSATTEEISRGMESIKTVAEQSYDSVTWTAECSHELTSLTSDLNGMVGSFKLGNVVDGDFVHISNQTKH
ncbi:MAG: methyl-accepting chemotaxis protein, partial [Gammaproteobacteria bacterium]|nr:methyl-accepting chemotaxis protein [Gammaproteobacteria bacterium]